MFQTDFALPGALEWVVSLLLGTMGTSVAILAVAGLGALALSGWIETRRALSVVIGCFVLFSARSLAIGLTSIPVAERASTEAVLPAEPQPKPLAPPSYDPYAFATSPR